MTTATQPPDTREFPGPEELRALRERAGVSRQRLAELAGCSFGAVTQFERGLRPSRSATLARIVGVLEILNEQRPGGDPTVAKADGTGRTSA